MQDLKKHIASFFPFAQKQLGFKRPPKLFFVNDKQNAGETLGKTAYYEPQTETIKIYVTDRHPKDVLRSFSHELVHHAQNCRGDFDNDTVTEEGYAQNDPHLREMEREAYEKGNMIFRDYTDSLANNGGLEKMSMTEEKLREAVRAAIQRLAEKSGGMPMKKDKNDADGDGDKDDMVPAFLKQEETEQVEEGEVPDQLKSFVKGKKKDDKDEDKKEEKVDERNMDPYDGTPFGRPGSEDRDTAYGSIRNKDKKKKPEHKDKEKGAEELDESPSHPASDRSQGRDTGRRVKDVNSGERKEVAESVDELKEWYLGTLSESLVKKFTQK
jgi:hypothetical protein